MLMGCAVFMDYRGRVSDRGVVTFGVPQHDPQGQTDREGNHRGT